MKRNARRAFDSLKGIGATVINHCENGEPLEDQWGAHFILSAEDHCPKTGPFADSLGESIREHRDIETGEIINMFGIRHDVNTILQQNGLYAEWIDPGTIGIYDA